jgi:hypothetical protein
VNLQELFQTLVQMTSADVVFEHIREIQQTNRGSSFRQYERTADSVVEKIKEIGLEAERIDLPADGETKFGDAVMPLAWHCDEAEVEITQPTPTPLGNYRDHPHLVGMWSPDTPEEGMEADVVILESGDASELEKMQVEGKWVYTPRRFRDIRREAARLGAVGVISSGLLHPTSKTDTQWIGANTDIPGGWGTQKKEKPLIALSIAPEQGEQLARMAAEGTVRVRAKIKAELYAGTLPMITATIPGRESEQEVLLLAPLYGPGAHYPAAGAAVLIECARVLKRLIDSTTTNRSRRAIRFLWAPKLYGAMAYVYQRKEFLDRTLFALVLETGAGNPDISWCRWSYRPSPVMFRHFTDGVGWTICQEYLAAYRPQRFCELRPFSLHADVFYNDPAIGVSTHWLTGGADEECKHTSADRVETVDRRSCIDLTVAVSALLHHLAGAGKGEMTQYAFWNYQLAHDRLHEDLDHYLSLIADAKTQQDLSDIHTQVLARLPLRVNLESRLLQSLETLTANAADTAEWVVVQELLGALKNAGESAQTLVRHALENRAGQLGLSFSYPDRLEARIGDERIPIPDGNALGTITLDAIPYEEWTAPVKTSPRNNLPYILSWWLVDEKRTIGEIEDIVRLETDRYRECVPAWFTFLQKHGYIVFQEAGGQTDS